MTSRRAFLLGAASLLAAPAVVKASSLMPLWVPPKPTWGDAVNAQYVQMLETVYPVTDLSTGTAWYRTLITVDGLLSYEKLEESPYIMVDWQDWKPHAGA